MGAAAAAAIQGGSGLIGTSLSALYNKRAYEREHADKIRDWYRENQYNSPSAQMSRLKAAGLNPNLVYASGNAVNPAGSIESSQFQPLQNEIASSGSSAANTLIDSYYRERELENEESNIMSLVAYRAFLNDFTESKTKGQNLGNEKAETEREYWSENAYFDFMTRRQAFKNARQEYEKMKAETALTWSNNSYTRQGIKNLKKQYDLNDAQIQSLQEGMRKMQTEEWQILFNAGLEKMRYDLSVKEKSALIGKYVQEITNMQAEYDHIVAETEYSNAKTYNANTSGSLKAFMATGRERLASDLRGENGKVDEICAQMLYNIFELLDKLPFTGKLNF